MKTGVLEAPHSAAAVVELSEASPDDAGMALMLSARAFSEPLLLGHRLETGEEALAHADAVAAILQGIGAAPVMQAAAFLVYAGDLLDDVEAVVAKAFGGSLASLVASTRKLEHIQRATQEVQTGQQRPADQIEGLRRMLLAFSRDLRVVLLLLASRLQTLRFCAASKQKCPGALAAESLEVFAPLANRLGIWQIKWELEDLSFRFLEPEQYQKVARLLDERRAEREQRLEVFRLQLADDLSEHGLLAEVHARPKHIYSIWKKMQGKRLEFAQLNDLRAVRVIVSDVTGCYAVLGRVHAIFRAVAGEFEDYIERPKPNGYQSLHTVVLDGTGRAVEVQIRTREMHEHAEHGVAAHWAYKDAGIKGYTGLSADAGQQARVAEARKAVLRQLLAWERDTAEQVGGDARASKDDHIYVFTPAATVIELPTGATPIDFAYAVHTDLGHRCRGAKVDGAIVPLNTPLVSGQSIDVIASKEGGPSLDWLNSDLGFLKSSRAKSKVRAWFNVLAQRDTVARGRAAVEKLLQREGRAAMKHDELAVHMGFRNADALFEVVGKEELSLRTIETALRPAETLPSPDELIAQRKSSGRSPKGGVLVVGVDSLMTNLARCCRPAPPDAIGGFVTRSRGVAVHRAGCTNFRQMAQRSPERVIAVAWGARRGGKPDLYPIEVRVEAADREGLLRDISELFAKEKMNVIGVNTQSVKDLGAATAWMTFTIEVADAARLASVLELAGRIAGVRSVRRK